MQPRSPSIRSRCDDGFVSDDTDPKPILRTPPSGITRWFLEAPKAMYRAGLGWMLGNRFVMIEHTGRRSGRTYRTVVEVIGRAGNTIDVAAAWGPTSDWFRNVQANPEVVVSSGRLRDEPATAGVLDDAAAGAVFAAYTQNHPRAAATLSRSLGLPLDDPAAMARSVPAVRFTLR